MQQYTDTHLFGFNTCIERTAEEPRETEEPPYAAHYHSIVIVLEKLVHCLNEYFYQIVYDRQNRKHSSTIV